MRSSGDVNRPPGYASAACATSGGHAAYPTRPTVKTTPEPIPGVSSSTTNQAKPAAARTTPNRLEGRRAHATTPVMTSAPPAPTNARFAAIESPPSEPAGSWRATASDAPPSAKPATMTASCLALTSAPSHTHGHALRDYPCSRGPHGGLVPICAAWPRRSFGGTEREADHGQSRSQAVDSSRGSSGGPRPLGRRLPWKQVGQSRWRGAPEAGGADDGQQQRLYSGAGPIRGSGRPPLQPLDPDRVQKRLAKGNAQL